MADIPKGGMKPKPKPKPKPKSGSKRGALNAVQKGESEVSIGAGILEKDPSPGKDKGGDGKDDYKPGATSGETPDIDNARKTPARTPGGSDKEGDGQSEGEEEKQNPNKGKLLDNGDDQPDDADPQEQPKPENPIEAAKKKMRRWRRVWLFLKIFFPVFLLIVAIAWLSSCVSNIFGFGSNGAGNVSQSNMDSLHVDDGKLRRDVTQDGEDTVMDYDEDDLLNFADEVGSLIEPKNKDGDGEDGESEANGWREVILRRARQIIGSSYSTSGYNWTGSPGTSSFTCSGVVDYAFGFASRSHSPETLMEACKGNGSYTEDISKLQAGDLVFYACLGRAPGHVGIYIGNNQVIDSIPDGGVKIRTADYMTPMGGGTFKEFGDEIKAEIEAAEARAKSGGGSINDGPINEKQQRIINAAKSVSSPGGGRCAQWVSMVFDAAGFGYPYGNANDQYYAYCTSSNKSDLKPGMIVAIPRHSATELGAIYGHVGIYIGGGMLMDNVGEIRTISVDQWINDYNSWKIDEEVKWGWGPGGALA